MTRTKSPFDRRYDADAIAAANSRRVRSAPFLVVKTINGVEKVLGHATKRPAAERQAAVVGGRVVERGGA